MVKPNGIWDLVRNNLKQAIDNVSDETTELIVIPFTDRSHPLSVSQQPATPEGKAFLKKMIEGLVPVKECYTNHLVPLQDFYNNRVDPSRITYMFLMTDGQSNQDKEAFKTDLRRWGARYGNKNVYTFYVMLNEAAKDSTVEQIIASQDHLWKVESADVNVNLIRLDNEAVFNVRNDKYVDIPLHGNVDSASLTCRFIDDTYYSVGKYELTREYLRLYIEPTRPTSQLPQDVSLQLSVTMDKHPAFTYLVTDRVSVLCKNKKEYTLKVSVK